jgi:hypothetical protein
MSPLFAAGALESAIVVAAKTALLHASEPPDPLRVAIFHSIGDFGVLIAIWLLTLRPRELTLRQNKPPAKRVFEP